MKRLRSQRHPAALLAVALCLLALLLGAWQTSARRAGSHLWLDNAICSSAAPLQGLLVGGSRQVAAGIGAFARVGRLQQENERLAARAADLEARLALAEERRGQRRRERSLYAAYPGAAVSGRMARVIGSGEEGWLSYLIIDRGRADGVCVRDVAVARDGVVGQVYAIADRSSRVLPITDAASGVAVRVQRSREVGILKGAGPGRAELRYLGPQAQARAGDVLLTAGTGGVFPRGLRVGIITSVTPDADTSGKMAQVALSVELRNVEEVLLVRAAAVR